MDSHARKKGPKLRILVWAVMFAALFLPRTIHAMDQVRIAVFNFVTLNMEASGYGTTVTNMLGDALKNNPVHNVMDRKDLEAFLYLNDLRQDDRVENAVNVGTRLGLNMVIVGNVEKKGAWIIVNCRVVSVEQKKTIFNTRVGGRGDAGLSQEIRKLAGTISETLASHAKVGDVQLKAPINVKARPGNRQIYLGWEDPPDAAADGYDIFRSGTEGGPFAKIAQVNQREYLDKDLEKSAVYYYKIKSFTNAGLQSGLTNVIKGETALTPNPPVILRADSRVGSVQLTWSPSPIASDDPLPLAGYKLFRAEKQQGPFREISDLNGTDLNISGPIDKAYKVVYVDKNLKDAQEVYYRLSVYNEKKIESGFSSIIKGMALPVVSGLSAQSGLVQEVRLSWNAIDASLLKGYNIYRNLKEEGEYTRIRQLEKEGAEGKVQFSDRKDLEDGHRYYYRVTAYDDADQQTTPSAAVHADTKPRPVRPAVLRAEPLKVKSVPLAWRANPEKDIVAYHVYRREGSDGRFSDIAKTAGGDTQYRDRDLKDGVSYSYKIQAEDKDGLRSDFSEEIQVSTKPRPKNPEILTGEYSGGTVALAWKPVAEKDLAHYKVYEKTFWKTDVVPGLERVTPASVQFKTVIDKGKKKTYVVTAVDQDGLESEYSTEVVVTGN
jgi:hypothetical protein